MGELSAYAFELVDFIADAARADGISLLDAIKRASAAQIKKTQDGLVLTGVSANSASSTFSFVSSFRPAQIIQLLNLLRQLHALALADLMRGGNEDPTDAEILNWIHLHIGDCFYTSEIIDYRRAIL